MDEACLTLTMWVYPLENYLVLNSKKINGFISSVPKGVLKHVPISKLKPKSWTWQDGEYIRRRTWPLFPGLASFLYRPGAFRHQISFLPRFLTPPPRFKIDGLPIQSSSGSYLALRMIHFSCCCSLNKLKWHSPRVSMRSWRDFSAIWFQPDSLLNFVYTHFVYPHILISDGFAQDVSLEKMGLEGLLPKVRISHLLQGEPWVLLSVIHHFLLPNSGQWDASSSPYTHTS